MNEPRFSPTQSGRAVPRSQLHRVWEPDAFWWATGIEDTFITAPSPRRGRSLDEYALTEHYERWSQDLGLVAELGVKTARYGIPWHRVNPGMNLWDWTFADNTLERLLELGIDPIVDLVHYGTPDWLNGAFLNPDYPRYVSEYAARLAERFKGRIFWYTPLNEPRITAWYCGRLGWWPPFKRGWRGFVELMLAICRGIVQTAEALRGVDPEIVLVHVDATDLYSTRDPMLRAEAERRQQIVFLALDLISGRVDAAHPLYDWLVSHGAQENALAWFIDRRVDLDLVGLNLYPMYSQKELADSSQGLRTKMPYASGDLVERLAQLYWEHYQRPLMLTETAAQGPGVRRQKWLDDSVDAVRRVRGHGIPLIGYTWWPLFSLVGWAYREGKKELAEYFLNLGLWDLDPHTLDRMPTSLIEAYRECATGGHRRVGELVGAQHLPRAA